jgi:hypothetical protein
LIWKEAMRISTPGRRPALTVCALAATLAVPSSAAADTVTSTFEAPLFKAGSSVDLVQGWSSFGAAGLGGSLFDHRVAETTDSAIPSSFGGQSLRISNAVTSGSFGDQTFSPSVPNDAGETGAESDGWTGGTRQSEFDARWTFIPAKPAEGAPPADMSVVVSPDRGDGARMSWVQMLDTADGAGIDVNFYDANSDGSFDPVPTPVVANLDRDKPHTIRLWMKFADGPKNDIVKVFVDGKLEHTGGSWEQYFRVVEGKPTRPVDSLLFRTSGTAAPGNAGLGFMLDNVSASTPALGATGPQGHTGPKGPAGPQGPTGPHGPAGVRGATGPQGEQGPAGPSAVVGKVAIANSHLRVSERGEARVKLASAAGAGLYEGRVLLRAGSKQVGRGKFTVRAGKTTRVNVRLTKRALRRVKSGSLKRVHAYAFSRDLAGHAVEAARTLSVRAPR